MSKSRILSAVFSSLITKAQGNAVGQIAGIGAVSGGKNWKKYHDMKDRAGGRWTVPVRNSDFRLQTRTRTPRTVDTLQACPEIS